MDWRYHLMLWHPRLFRPTTDEPYRTLGYPNCERGWQGVLVLLCRRIEMALGDREEFEFIRIKQKFGTLRLYWEAEASEETNAKIDNAVDLAVARSACTCEVCSREGRLHNNEGWLETRCAEHAVGTPVLPRYGTGFETVHRLRRRLGQAEVYYARYDRQADSLTEVEPPPSARRKV